MSRSLMPKPWPHASTKCLLRQTKRSRHREGKPLQKLRVRTSHLTWRPPSAASLCCRDTSWCSHRPERLGHMRVAQRSPKERHRSRVILPAVRARVRGFFRTRHLNADAALQLQLQTDHVHLAGGAKLLYLGHLLAHFVDGHFDGAQVGVVLVHDRDALLHVGETVSGCGTKTHRAGSDSSPPREAFCEANFSFFCVGFFKLPPWI